MCHPWRETGSTVLSRREFEGSHSKRLIREAGSIAEAVRSGLGWGLLPEQQLRPGEADGSLVGLGRQRVDVPLHWIRWRLDSPVLERLGEAVTTVAGRVLRPAT